MQHFYRDVPGWAAFADLYVAMVRKFPTGSTFVEIGCYMGRSAALMAVEIANSGKAIDFYCVDPWLDGGADLRHTEFYVADQSLYKTFLHFTAPVANYIKPMRTYSVEAAKSFAPGSVDFIMIDGLHTYEAVKEDIAAWLPKMHPGSVMSGDDYTWPGVEKAVNEAFPGKRHTAVINKGKGRKRDYKLDGSYWIVQL